MTKTPETAWIVWGEDGTGIAYANPEDIEEGHDAAAYVEKDFADASAAASALRPEADDALEDFAAHIRNQTVTRAIKEVEAMYGAGKDELVAALRAMP